MHVEKYSKQKIEFEKICSSDSPRGNRCDFHCNVTKSSARKQPTHFTLLYFDRMLKRLCQINCFKKQQVTMSRIHLVVTSLLLAFAHVSYGFRGTFAISRIGDHWRQTIHCLATTRNDDAHLSEGHHGEEDSNFAIPPSSLHQTSRRGYLASSIIATATGLVINPATASAEYKPSVRPTAYRVDSTIPPSLLPIADKKKEPILTALGKGSGTDKEAVFIDTVNLNNILNKAVFGTINAISGLNNPKVSDSGPGFATFVCMGFPSQKSEKDIALAFQLLDPIIKPRKNLPTALGLAGIPYSAQDSLDAYTTGSLSLIDLTDSLQKTGVDGSDVEFYQPLLEWAKKNQVDLLALSPELEDAETARTQGLQFVDAARRSAYVVDPEGFIGLTQDPRFKMYTDRSLLKDFRPRNEKETQGNFYAERILNHEAGATAAARYASSRPDSMVIIMAPVKDVRFLNGINGRIPRVFAKLRPNDDSKVTDNSVTTILLNPTASDTLSLSNYLRLEIGTSPEVLDYQTKVADYLWFSSSPKVNQIPRLMNG